MKIAYSRGLSFNLNCRYFVYSRRETSDLRYGDTFKFVGGLGNQIPIFVAMLYRSIKAPQIMDLSQIAHHNRRWRNTILGLDFKLSNQIEQSIKPILVFTRAHYRGENVFQAANAGFETDLTCQSSSTRFEGFFQTYLYKHLLETELGSELEIGVSRSRAWFQQLENELQVSSSAVIHIRRGDYINESQERGLLNLNYYKRALEYIPSNSYARLIVVTDAAKTDISDFQELTPGRISLINSNYSLYSTELFNIFLHAKYLVMANSSLSWSAGLFRKDPKSVFYPSQWFKSGEAFHHHFNPNWKCVPLDADKDYQ
jgi:hypothetical protein